MAGRDPGSRAISSSSARRSRSASPARRANQVRRASTWVRRNSVGREMRQGAPDLGLVFGGAGPIEPELARRPDRRAGGGGRRRATRVPPRIGRFASPGWPSPARSGRHREQLVTPFRGSAASSRSGWGWPYRAGPAPGWCRPGRSDPSPRGRDGEPRRNAPGACRGVPASPVPPCPTSPASARAAGSSGFGDRKSMALERLARSHHGGTTLERRARRNPGPCRLGTVGMPEGQLAESRGRTGPRRHRASGRPAGASRARPRRASRGQRRAGPAASRPAAARSRMPRSPRRRPEVRSRRSTIADAPGPPASARHATTPEVVRSGVVAACSAV